MVLPSSLTQNLFYLALLRHSEGEQSTPLSPALPQKLAQHSTPYTWQQSLVGPCYALFVMILPYDDPPIVYMMPLIQLFPIIPLFFSLEGDMGEGRIAKIAIALSWAMVLIISYFPLLQVLGLCFKVEGWSKLHQALFSHPAVTCVGQDVLLSAASWLWWMTLVDQKNNGGDQIETPADYVVKSD